MSEQLISLWNRSKLINLTGIRELATSWAIENSLLPSSKTCHHHRVTMKLPISDLSAGEGLGYFQCPEPHRDSGRKAVLAKNSWFKQSHLEPHTVLNLCYKFCKDLNYEDAIMEVAELRSTERLSARTVCDWYNFCREMIVLDFPARQAEHGKIGGEGKIVKADESKFSKRKFNRGRQIEGHWVLSMIEDDSDEFRMIICPDNVRSADTLLHSYPSC